MYRIASALLAILLIACRAASGSPPPDELIHEPGRLLDTAETIILVRVVESNPPSTSATVRVLKSWKGPFSVGRVLHVEGRGAVSCRVAIPGSTGPTWPTTGSCDSYTFQAADKELLIALFDAKDRDPIAAWDGSVWSAAESQGLIRELDQAVSPRAP